MRWIHALHAPANRRPDRMGPDQAGQSVLAHSADIDNRAIGCDQVEVRANAYPVLAFRWLGQIVRMPVIHYILTITVLRGEPVALMPLAGPATRVVAVVTLAPA